MRLLDIIYSLAILAFTIPVRADHYDLEVVIHYNCGDRGCGWFSYIYGHDHPPVAPFFEKTVCTNGFEQTGVNNTLICTDISDTQKLDAYVIMHPNETQTFYIRYHHVIEDGRQFDWFGNYSYDLGPRLQSVPGEPGLYFEIPVYLSTTDGTMP